MATYRITQVHLAETYSGGHHHHHIESVRLSDGQTVTRQAVANAIRNGDVVYTFPPGPTPQAQVYVKLYCPSYACMSTDYITTHPDDTTKNNLLSLPRF